MMPKTVCPTTDGLLTVLISSGGPPLRASCFGACRLSQRVIDHPKERIGLEWLPDDSVRVLAHDPLNLPDAKPVIRSTGRSGRAARDGVAALASTEVRAMETCEGKSAPASILKLLRDEFSVKLLLYERGSCSFWGFCGARLRRRTLSHRASAVRWPGYKAAKLSA
jgi:hypothetical protein